MSSAIANLIADQTFPIFSKLPTETRQMIRRYVCFQYRSVDVRIRSSRAVRDRLVEPHLLDYHYYSSTSNIPSILHTDREARQEGLKWYTLDFGITQKGPGFSFSTPPKIYINWKVDTFCLWHESLQMACIDELARDLKAKIRKSTSAYLVIRGQVGVRFVLPPELLEKLGTWFLFIM